MENWIFFGSLIHSYNELEITAQKAITKCRKVRYPIYLSQIRFAPFYSKRKKTAGSSLFILSSLGFQVRDDSAPLSWMAHQQQWIRTEMSPTQARTSTDLRFPCVSSCTMEMILAMGQRHDLTSSPFRLKFQAVWNLWLFLRYSLLCNSFLEQTRHVAPNRGAIFTPSSRMPLLSSELATD